MGAALTFYAILSLIPVLIVATAVAGLGFWQKLAEAEVLRQIQALLGETSARVLQAAILSANRPALGAIASTIGVGTILVGASGAFVELQDALNNKIWRVERKSGSILLGAIRQRFLSFSLVLGTGFLLLLSLVSSAALGAVERFMGHLLPWPVFLLELVDFLLSFGVITLLLALIFKLLPDTQIAWSDVWIGAAIASLLFTIGKVLIGLYLGRVRRRLSVRGSVIPSRYPCLDLLLGTDFSLWCGSHARLRQQTRLASRIEHSRTATSGSRGVDIIPHHLNRVEYRIDRNVQTWS